MVALNLLKTHLLLWCKSVKKWGFIDTTGNFVIEPQFLDAKNFQ
ncbi:MAG: WG repeat-containing protein [Bacteroidales bacterium]|nr:WG repeat-containing protein [Bacteroidales bacterium]